MSKPQREELEKDKKDGLKALESEENVETDEEIKKINDMSDEQVFKNLLYLQYMKEKKKKETKPKKTKWFDENRVTKILNEKVPGQFCTKRPGPSNTSLTYLEGNVVINFANAIFGPFGWSTSITNKTVDVKIEKGKANAIASANVRVTLPNGAYHEDVGVGTSTQSNAQAARENAEKACITDGIKRALRQFGNLLGNSLYDSDYVRSLDVNHKDVIDNIDFDVIETYIEKEKVRRIERKELEKQKNNPVKKEIPLKKEEKKEEDNEIDDILKLLEEEKKEN